GGRAGRRRRLGRRPRAAGCPGPSARVRRRRGRGGGARRGRVVRPAVHPGAGRDRLHLGARGSPVLPARDDPARPARPVRREGGRRGPGLAIGAWVIPALVQYGTKEQQQRFLPPTLRGDYLWCQLFSEPGAGSDLAGLTTRAVRAEKGEGEAGGWKLTGQKIW